MIRKLIFLFIIRIRYYIIDRFLILLDSYSYFITVRCGTVTMKRDITLTVYPPRDNEQSMTNGHRGKRHTFITGVKRLLCPSDYYT